MNVTLKQCRSDKNVASKSFSGTEVTLDCQIKNECSVYEPALYVKSSSGIYNFNYADISELGRKYFVTDIKLMNVDTYEIHLHVDVLSTYISALRNQSAVIRRQANKYNLYLDDEKFITYKNDTIQTKEFPKGFNKILNYVLVVNGS